MASEKNDVLNKMNKHLLPLWNKVEKNIAPMSIPIGFDSIEKKTHFVASEYFRKNKEEIKQMINSYEAQEKFEELEVLEKTDKSLFVLDFSFLFR